MHTIEEKIQEASKELEELKALVSLRAQVAQLKKELGLTEGPTGKKVFQDVVESNVILAGEEPASVEKNPVLDLVRNMGSAYFVSRVYDELPGCSNKNWKLAGSQTLRNSTYQKLTGDQKVEAARLVAGMSANRLNTNKIGLTGEKVIEMAKAICNR